MADTPVTAITLGAAPSDDLKSISAWTSTNANAIVKSFNAFLQAYVMDKNYSFDSIGDTSTLNYLQWDYNQELRALGNLFPAFLSFNATVDQDIDKLASVDAPSVPALTAVTPAMPSYDAQRPDVTMPTLPGTDVGAAPVDVPPFADVVFPDAPTVALPTVPTFDMLNIPASPALSIPALSSQVPSFNLSPPTAQFAYVSQAYVSQLSDPLVAKLLYDLENGGYGIDATDEQALWARARDRAAATARENTEEALRRVSQLSAPMPGGAYLSEMARVRREELAALSDANREIALKRADMYVENRRFTIQQVQAYEQLDRALFNAIQERALNAAKAAADVGIALYDASVRAFTAQLEAYKAEAQTFETRIRAELLKVEVFRSQIEAEKLKSAVNQDRINLFQSQLNGIQTVVNLYKTRVEAANTMLEGQMQVVSIYRARVDAYANKVRAKEAEYGMYRAAVDGQVARMQVYKTDVDAYSARVQAEETRVRALVQANGLLLDKYKGQLAGYAAQLEALTKRVEARTERDRTYTQVAQSNTSSYRALVDTILAGIKVKEGVQEANNQWNIVAVNSNIEMMKMRLEQLKATVANRTAIDSHAVDMFGNMLMTSMNTVAGLSVKSA